jgi:hypothetical protein
VALPRQLLVNPWLDASLPVAPRSSYTLPYAICKSYVSEQALHATSWRPDRRAAAPAAACKANWLAKRLTATLALLCVIRLAAADMQKFSWQLGTWKITKYLDRYNVWPVDAMLSSRSRTSADRATAVTGTTRHLVRCFQHDRQAPRRRKGASTFARHARLSHLNVRFLAALMPDSEVCNADPTAELAAMPAREQ